MDRPRWLPGIVALGLATGLGFSCSKRPVETYPDAERLCTLRCAQLFGTCHPTEYPAAPSDHQNESECVSTCKDRGVWKGDCRWEQAALAECVGALGCEAYARFMTPPDDIQENPRAYYDDRTRPCYTELMDEHRACLGITYE